MNCNAATAETAAGMAHQKYIQVRHSLVIGCRLDLGKGCNLGKDSSLWPSAIPRKAFKGKDTLAPGERVPSSQWNMAVPPYQPHTWTQGKEGRGALSNQFFINCSNGGECKLRKIQSKNDSKSYSPPVSEGDAIPAIKDRGHTSELVLAHAWCSILSFVVISAGQNNQQDWDSRKVATKMVFHLQIIRAAILHTSTYLFF